MNRLFHTEHAVKPVPMEGRKADPGVGKVQGIFCSPWRHPLPKQHGYVVP